GALGLAARAAASFLGRAGFSTILTLAARAASAAKPKGAVLGRIAVAAAGFISTSARLAPAGQAGVTAIVARGAAAVRAAGALAGRLGLAARAVSATSGAARPAGAWGMLARAAVMTSAKATMAAGA